MDWEEDPRHSARTSEAAAPVGTKTISVREAEESGVADRARTRSRGSGPVALAIAWEGLGVWRRFWLGLTRERRRKGMADHLSEKSSLVGILKSRAILNAKGKLGSYFPVSSALMV